MRTFNTPFFPDILVCSEVMGKGVDLQRFCRHVIHHDLAWNPEAPSNSGPDALIALDVKPKAIIRSWFIFLT